MKSDRNISNDLSRRRKKNMGQKKICQQADQKKKTRKKLVRMTYFQNKGVEFDPFHR